MALFIGKSDLFGKNTSEAAAEEGESDLSYLSQWQASLPDDIGREDNSMSYDRDVLNQCSDPTCNSINPSFSLQKMFHPSDNLLIEEEKHMNFDLLAGVRRNVFDMTDGINKNLEKEFVTSNGSVNSKFAPKEMDELLSFDELKDESKSTLFKSASLLEEIKQSDFDKSHLIKNTKTLQEKDELINQLL